MACHPDVPAAAPRATSVRFGQVLTNLGSNAMKFTDDRRGRRCTAQLEEETPDERGAAGRPSPTPASASTAGGQAGALRALHPGGPVHHPPARRNRSGTGHLAQAGGRVGRRALGDQRGRRAAARFTFTARLARADLAQPAAGLATGRSPRQAGAGRRRQHDEPLHPARAAHRLGDGLGRGRLRRCRGGGRPAGRRRRRAVRDRPAGPLPARHRRGRARPADPERPEGPRPADAAALLGARPRPPGRDGPRGSARRSPSPCGTPTSTRASAAWSGSVSRPPTTTPAALHRPMT